MRHTTTHLANQTYSKFESLTDFKYNFFMKSQNTNRNAAIALILCGFIAQYFNMDGAAIPILFGTLLALTS